MLLDDLDGTKQGCSLPGEFHHEYRTNREIRRNENAEVRVLATEALNLGYAFCIESRRTDHTVNRRIQTCRDRIHRGIRGGEDDRNLVAGNITQGILDIDRRTHAQSIGGSDRIDDSAAHAPPCTDHRHLHVGSLCHRCERGLPIERPHDGHRWLRYEEGLREVMHVVEPDPIDPIDDLGDIQQRLIV